MDGQLLRSRVECLKETRETAVISTEVAFGGESGILELKLLTLLLRQVKKRVVSTVWSLHTGSTSGDDSPPKSS